MVAVLFPALYVVLCVVLVVRTKKASSSNVTVNKFQKQVSQNIFMSPPPIADPGFTLGELGKLDKKLMFLSNFDQKCHFSNENFGC
jgi:hypothetical protein